MALSYDQVKTALASATAESGGTFIPFDVNYFVKNYGSQMVGYTGTPLQFYVEQGAALGDLPNAWFDPAYYVGDYKDLAPLAGTADLLVQYALYGVNEGRSPGPALNNFDGARYLADNPDVKTYVDANLDEFKTIDPSTGLPVSDAQAETQGAIAHYVKFGAAEGRYAYDTGGQLIIDPPPAPPLSAPIQVDYPTQPITSTTAHDVTVALNTNDGHTLLTAAATPADANSPLNSDGSNNPTLHLTGDASIRINVTNVLNQVTGIDLNGDGVIAANGVENNVSGAGIFTAQNFTMFDAYPRDPLNEGDRVNNYLGDLYYDGTGYAGTGAVVPPGSNPTNGNIVLGGLGADNIFGGLGNDFLAGGGVAPSRFLAQIVNGVQVLVDGLTGKPVASWDPVAKLYTDLTTGAAFYTDQLHGGRNSDFMFADLSTLTNTDGNNTNYDGGNTTDSSPGTGTPESQSGANTQNNDWILLEAHDDNESVTVNLNNVAGGTAEDPNGAIALRDGTHVGSLRNIESFDASGNLYGFLNNSTAELGSRATDTRIPAQQVGQVNFGEGSTAQLNITGNNAANIIVGGYGNDAISGQGGNDILFGSNLGFLEQYQNNPNLLNATGGLHLNVTAVGTVNGGKDVINGDQVPGNAIVDGGVAGNDSIVFQMTGGTINGEGEAPVDPNNRNLNPNGTYNPAVNVVSTGDTLYLDSFSVGRVDGATYTATTADPSESAAQAAALAKETTDSVVRFDLGLADDSTANPSGSSTLMYRNYGGADLANNVDLNGWTVHSADNTNYAAGMPRTLVTGIEGVITTGMGAIDYVAAGTDNPNLAFSNQQNFQALNATVDLRGIDSSAHAPDAPNANGYEQASGTSRIFGLFTATNFGSFNTDPALATNRADNVLYANTGNDVLEGRGGTDFLSGGLGNDDFIFAKGDNTDIIWRQQDSNGDNIQDKDANGNYLYTQDFNATPINGPSELDIAVTAAPAGSNPTLTLTAFQIVVDANNDGTTSNPAAGAPAPAPIDPNDLTITLADLNLPATPVHNFQDLATEINTAFQANPKYAGLSAKWVGNTPTDVYNGKLEIVDSEGRVISDNDGTNGNLETRPGYDFAAAFPNGSVSNVATFVSSQAPQDRLILKSYLDRANNTGVDTAKYDLTGLNANQMTVGYQNLDNTKTTTTLASQQEYRIQFENLHADDKVTVTINGHAFTDTVKPGETTIDFTTRFANDISTTLQLDLNTSAGNLLATATHTTGQTSTADGVLVLTQNGASHLQQVFMDTPVVSVTNTVGVTSGTWAIADTSGNSINLYQFDGSNNNLNATDVLFVGTVQNPLDSHATTAPTADINKTPGAIDQSPTVDSKEVLATALTSGGILNGMNALVVPTVSGQAYTNVSANGKWAAINGDDQLIGGAGNDIISGGTGDDLIIGSAGTDTVDGGGNATAPDGSTITFNDVLLFQESDFVTASNPAASFYITLSPVLGSVGAGTVDVSDAKGAKLGTTTFTNIETVRTTSNSANDTLDVAGLSDAIVAKSGPGLTNLTSGPTNEGVNIFLTLTGGDNYSVDLNGDGTLQANEQHIPITDVYGEENVKAGGANDTVTIDDTQLGSNNKIDLGGQADKVEASGFYTLADQGYDLVTYAKDSIITDAKQQPVTTFAVESSANTDTVTSTGGILGTTTTTDTLVNVERVDFTAGTIPAGQTGTTAPAGTLADVLDVSGLATGATVNYGSAVTVGKSLGGGNDNKSVSNVDANTLSSGGVSATGNGLGNEKVIINGITNFERVRGGVGNDRVIVGDSSAMETITYQFDMGAGIDSLDYFQEKTQSVVDVHVDTSGTNTGTVQVKDAAGTVARTDHYSGVEQFYGSHTATNTIDLTGSTVDTKIAFSQYTTDAAGKNDVIPEPNGGPTGAVGLTHGILVSNDSAVANDPAFGTAYATFVDRSATNPTGAAYWTVVQGSNHAEYVTFTDNEVGVAHTLNLFGGSNTVDYSALTTTSVMATIGSVDTTTLNQMSTANSDTINVTRVRDNQASVQLTLDASTTTHGTLDVHKLQTSTVPNTVSQFDAQYQVVSLLAGQVIEDPNGQYLDAAGGLHNLGFVTDVNNFTNVDDSAGTSSVVITGDGASNTLTGGSAGDWIQGGDGLGSIAYSGDTLTGNGGRDLFIYTAETQSPGGVVGIDQSTAIFGTGVAGNTAVVDSRDTIADFTPSTDKLVFVIGDNYDAVRVSGSLPTNLNDSLNSVGSTAAEPLTDFNTPGIAVLNIPKDITTHTPPTPSASQYDNYNIATQNGNAPVSGSNADVELHVQMSDGGQRLDASAGQATGPLSLPAGDDIQVDFIYTAATQSQAAGYDQLIHFTPGQDKIDLSFLNAQDWQVTVPGGKYDATYNQPINLAPTPIVAYNSDAPGLFTDNAGIYHVVAEQTTTDAHGVPSTTAFIDANHDGSYEVGQDMVISLPGIASVTSDSFVFVANQYNTLPSNVPPTITGAAPVTGPAGSVLALPDLVFTDPDSNLAVTVNATNGTVGGLTDADPATPGIQLTGTPAALTAEFAAATFTGPAAGAADVLVSATDGVNPPATADIPVTLTAPNVAPTISGVAPVTGPTNTALPLPDLTFTDPDSNLTVTVTTPAGGTVGGLTDADPATPGIQLTGTPTAVTTAFAAATFTGTAAGAADVLVSATDGVNPPATADIPVTLTSGPTNATVNVDAATPSPITDGGALVNTSYLISGSASYTTQISGFDITNGAIDGSHDVLQFPAGVTPTVNNTSFGDGVVDVQWALAGNVVHIDLIGLPAAIDAQLNSVADFNTVFGANTII